MAKIHFPLHSNMYYPDYEKVQLHFTQTTSLKIRYISYNCKHVAQCCKHGVLCVLGPAAHQALVQYRVG